MVSTDYKMTAPQSSAGTAFNPAIPTLHDVPYRIHQLVDRSLIECIRFRYITVATEQLAAECRTMIATGQVEFADLARSISLDALTRDNGGLAGWVTINSADSLLGGSAVPLSAAATASNTSAPPPSPAGGGSIYKVSQEAALYPREVINRALFMNKGDISVVSSANASAPAFHVVQLVDVQARLTPQLTRRRKDSYLQMNNVLRKDEAVGNTASSPLTYYIDTMGCQMNVADSERMEGQLSDLGFTRTTLPYAAHLPPASGGEKPPAVVILNTCSIRDHAEQKVYSYLGPHALRKRKGENVCIIVAGCVAQQEGEKLLRRFPEIDIVMGPQYAPHLVDLLLKVAEGHQVVATDPIMVSEDSAHSYNSPLRKSSSHAYVNIIFGCNERCTYCVVPQTRGVEQSRTKEAIVTEIRELYQQGYGEVTLLGQNVDSWGRDFTPKQRFADLLEAVGKIGVRVRFLTSHPKYMSERVIQTVAANPEQLMPCFNVPFQSGSDRVLRNMRRGYTRERYLDIVRSIRAALPDTAITADCIVGFPGETEDDFLQTLSLMDEVQFDLVNTAAYSARPYTPAGDWENGVGLEHGPEGAADGATVGGTVGGAEGAAEGCAEGSIRVPEEEKQSRLQRINLLGEQHALKRSERFLGRSFAVLVEDISAKNPRMCVGRIPHSRLVYFEGDIASLRGHVVQVEVTVAKAYSLMGRLI